MILTKEIKVELTQFNYHHYKRIGYDTDNKDFIMVRIEDIGKRTSTKIDVKCDLCGKEKKINYRKYSDNISKYNIYTCSNKCAMFKNEITNLERYGDTHQCRNEEVKDRILSTKLDKGFISDSIEDFFDYRRVVNNLTNKIKKKLYENWNGYDYYDNTYIKENLAFDSNHKEYPTIDHKISVLTGYKNGISPTEIAKLENICITKRNNNSSKGYKTEEDYIKQKIQS